MPKQYFSEQPGRIIGYRKNGLPIRLIGGGSIDIPEPTPPQPTETDRRFTAADIQRAREQEKEKLYGRLTERDERLGTLEAQLQELRAEREQEAEARRQAEAERQRLAEEAERKAREEEMSVRDLLNQRDQEWEQKFTALQREQEERLLIAEKERELANLQSYIVKRVDEERENIAPQLIRYITGNTVDEVEASIATAKATTEEIYNEVSEAQTDLASQMRGVSPAGYAATDGPMDTQMGTKTYSVQELKDLPPSEWAKIRGNFVGGNKNVGLFG